MSRGETNSNSTWLEFNGHYLYFQANFNINKKGEREYEIEGEGSTLPDPLLFRKKTTPPPLHQFPGIAVQHGPTQIGLNLKNGFSTIIYHFFDELAGERLTLEVEKKGEFTRHPHKREFHVDPGNATLHLKVSKIDRREADKKISYSPTSLDKKLERLTEIRDSIQKEIEPYRV